MGLDEMIGPLAFGESTPKITHCLGLYLSPETIYIAECKRDKDKLTVEHLVRIPVPIPQGDGKDAKPTVGTGTLATDFLTDNEKLGGLIRQSISQVRWGTKDVMVTLSHHLGLLRYFTMPAVERQFWKSSIPVEAKKYIPIPFDTLSYDYQVLPLPPDASNKARQGALIAVTQKKNLSSVTTMLAGLGLNLVGMEVAPCSVLRLWQALERTGEQAYCQVHFDGGSVRILVADRGVPVFFREVFLGADASVADQRKIDLGGCVAFAQKQLGVGKISAIKVSGTNSSLSAWVDAFAQETSLPASVQDTPGMLSIKGGDWGGFASIGACLRFSSAKTMTLDLGAVGRVSDDEKRVAKDILAIAGAATALIVALGLGRTLMYNMKAKELKKYKRDYEIEQVFTGKKPAQIEEMLKGMRDQIDAAGAIGDPGPKKTEVLRELLVAMPEKVWLTQLALRDPLERGGQGARPELNLAGHAVAPTPQEEQDLAYNFRFKVSQSTPVTEAFGTDVQVSVSRAPEVAADPSGGDQGLNPEAFAEKQEKRTEWKLSARKK